MNLVWYNCVMNEKPHVPTVDSLMKKAELNLDRSPEQEELEQARERLQLPLAELDYDSTGEQYFEINGNKVLITFEAVPEKITPDFNSYITKYLAGRERNEFPETYEIDNWRRLSSFAYDDGAGKNILPEDYIFLINPSAEYKGGLALTNNKVVLLGGDVTAPSTIITLLHEIGHIRTPKEKLKVTSESDRDHFLAERLQSERMANAFVLKNIRRFLKEGQLRDDVLLEVIHQMQGSYDAQAVRGKAEKDKRQEQEIKIAENLRALKSLMKGENG